MALSALAATVDLAQRSARRRSATPTAAGRCPSRAARGRSPARPGPRYGRGHGRTVAPQARPSCDVPVVRSGPGAWRARVGPAAGGTEVGPGSVAQWAGPWVAASAAGSAGRSVAVSVAASGGRSGGASRWRGGRLRCRWVGRGRSIVGTGSRRRRSGVGVGRCATIASLGDGWGSGRSRARASAAERRRWCVEPDGALEPRTARRDPLAAARVRHRDRRRSDARRERGCRDPTGSPARRIRRSARRSRIEVQKPHGDDQAGALSGGHDVPGLLRPIGTASRTSRW